MPTTSQPLSKVDKGSENIVGRVVLIGSIWFLSVPVILPLLNLDPAGPPALVVMLLALLLPVAMFGAAYRGSVRFQELLLSLDLRFVVFFQSVRIVGIVFIALYTVGKMPALFAFWAGGIDIVISLTAPFVTFWIVPRIPFPRRTFLAWNWLGLIDFAIGIPIGVMYSPRPLGILTTDVSTELFSEFPLSFFAVGVPLATMLHIICLLQVRHGHRLGI